ncbi:hypothetical protein GH714_032644 [Hevea brasiliensis]|uniref:2-hydroxyacyl-CoA lyase n=1 Tax=Hevea brasiliensis TaxID=3981 RepID=A0A6A6L336_HEVBR|nr:hypothetical protein GH714_032644 [Hevea brasiliensis]
MLMKKDDILRITQDEAKEIKKKRLPSKAALKIRIEVSGRPGECYLDLPSAVLHQTVTESEAESLVTAAFNSSESKPIANGNPVLNSEIEGAAELLRKAERPLIVFDKGVAHARAENELRKLVETTGIPFLPTPMGKGLLPDTHELAASAARSLAIWGETELRKPHLGLVGDAKKLLELINKEIKDDPFSAVAEPDRLIVAVEGDSGFGFSAMEVETLVSYQLPVVVIVFNNGGVYGSDRRSPEEITGPFKGDPAPTSFVPGAAYHILIEAFGGKGYLVETPDELKSALAESCSARKPTVINVTIDPYAGAASGRLQHKS